MDKELNLIWDSIESLPITPSITGGALFNSGASMTEIQEFERKIGHSLPQDVIDSFLRHDGMPKENGYYCFWEGNFLSLKQSLIEQSERLRITQEIFGEANSPNYLTPEFVTGPVKAARWLPSWIPIIKKNKEPVCIDFDPAKGGTVGQIIEVDFEGSEVKVLAKSYREFLKMLVEHL